MTSLQKRAGYVADGGGVVVTEAEGYKLYLSEKISTGYLGVYAA